jgi:ribulose-phosphate 3-epimerase
MGWKDWMRGAEIEPSIYAADFSRLGEELGALLDGGAKIFQFDVGDGHFVEPVTIGPIVLESISPLFREHGGILDVHLMTEHPQKHFEAVAKAGGDSVTVHHEVVGDVLEEVARQARALGLEFGVAFNPETRVEDVVPHAPLVDLVLIMGIHPGYSGQAFLPETLERAARLRELLPPDLPIQVDGGVGLDNARELRDAGVSLLVAGSSVFGGDDPVAAYHELAAAVR